LLDRITDHYVTSLRVVLIANGTLPWQGVSLAGTWDTYQHDVLAFDYVLAQKHVYRPQITALDNDPDFAHTAYGFPGQIHSEIAETTVIEHETFNVLGLAHELRMCER